MDELIEVGGYPNAAEAHIAKNVLEEHGIEAFVSDENSATVMWSALVDVKVMVAAPDEAKARAVLAEHADASMEDVDVGDAEEELDDDEDVDEI